MMKKLRYSTLFILLGVLLSSCVDDLFDNKKDISSDGKITLNIGIEISDVSHVSTRGLIEEANGEGTDVYLKDLIPYIFIFEDTGSPGSNYLRSLVYGDKITPGDVYQDPGGDNRKYMTFSATVDGTSEKAIIHLVAIHANARADFEEQLSKMTDRSELDIFSGANGLSTTGASYWKRILLGKPINNDPATKEEVAQKLQRVRMVKNFSRVTMKQNPETSNFQLEGFVIVNALDRGYVAAYNERSADISENFIDFEKEGQQLSYDVLKENYSPIRHPKADRYHKDNETSWINGLTEEEWDREKPKYMFETPYHETHRTFVLIKGKYGNSTGSTYYKLEIGDYDKIYEAYECFDLIRNISYDITINEVSGEGRAAAKEAITGPPSNNISASVETRNLLTITDGLDKMTLEVYNADTNTKIKANTVVIVKEDDGRTYPSGVNVRWQYQTQNNAAGTYSNNAIKHDFPGYSLNAPGPIIDGPAEEWYEAGNDWKGYKLNFREPDGNPKKETVRFFYPMGLSRDMTLILREKWNFINRAGYDSNVEVYPGHYSFEDGNMPGETLADVRGKIPVPGEVGSQREAKLTVMFELPSDIPQELFPMDFKIGFDRQNVENVYGGNTTAVYGETMFDDDGSLKGTQRLQFVRTITWEEYHGTEDPGNNGHKLITVKFKTTTDVLGTEDNDGETSRTRVRVYNPYFNIGEDTFLRSARNNNGDPDPSRTVWAWYFGDPGWDDYIGNQTADGANFYPAGRYNELTFSTYKRGNQYGPYLAFRPGYSADNPEISFYVNATAPAEGYTGRLKVTGASLYYSIGRTYYRRTGYAQIVIENSSGQRTVNLPIGDYDKAQDKNANPAIGYPLELETFPFTIRPGETVKQVKIWSGKLSDSDSEEYPNAMTLYYGIRFELQ